MTYPVSELISNAYYVSGIVAREFQTVTGGQEATGLDILNEILGDKRAEDDMLPYYDRYTFNTVAGQETYFIENLIDVDSLTFALDTVRYSMDKKDRIEYFATARANNIQSLPVMYHVERQKGGANVYLYFLPNQVYQMELWGQFGLEAIESLQLDLLTVFDRFYINYLKYMLAKMLCVNFNYDVPPFVAEKVDYYEGIIASQSNQMDLKMQKVSTFGQANFLNYAQANIGKGWTVP